MIFGGRCQADSSERRRRWDPQGFRLCDLAKALGAGVELQKVGPGPEQSTLPKPTA